MSSISIATIIYNGIITAVITIAINIILFRKLWEKGNKSRDEGISKQGHPNTPRPQLTDQDAGDEHKLDVSIPVQPSTIPLPEPVDHSAGGEGQLGILAPSHALSTGTSELRSINQTAKDEHNFDISTQTQGPNIPRPQPVNHSAEDEGRLVISVPSHGQPPTILGPQCIGQDDRDEHNFDVSISAQASTTLLPQPVDSAGDEGQHGISVPSHPPPITSEAQFISMPVQTSTTSPSYGDIGSKKVSPISLSQGSSNFQISETNATVILNGDERFTKIQRKLIYDCITDLPDINNTLKEHVLTQSITTLPRAKAMFRDHQNKKSAPYFKDTIMALLREMADCVTGSSKYRMNILSGPAASGKSTVAYTIASRAACLNLLGASFCFSRDETDRNNAKIFFTTIAYQLCVYNEAFAKAIGDVLETERGSAAVTKDLQTQLQSLILDPLQRIVQSHSRPTLIIVDALDECDEKDAFSVLTGLSELVRDLPSFNVILTTRPQPYLDCFLRSWSGHILFCLQDIENKVVDGDVRLYLDHCLSLDQVQIHFPKWQWCASDQEIDSLVRSAGRFLIIASTAVRYILDKTASNPAAQMEKLLHDSAQDHSHFKNLDHFYTVILRDVVPEDCSDDDIVSRYQSVVGTILSVQHPLPVSALVHFVGIDMEEIRAVLDKLQSVILLGDDDVPRIHHKSFSEYVTDQSRCKDLHLRIDPEARTRHTQIATCCFEILNKHLKRNILGLGDPARLMSNEDGLKEDGITNGKLEEKIPQQLRYACVYWVYHLKAGNIEDAALIRRLETFVNEHMLHWFEVLSLVGKLDSAHVAIGVVLKLLELSSDLHQLLSDGLHFIERSYKIIRRSALHTYYSALLLTPTNSQLYRRYMTEDVHKILGIEDGPENWGPVVAKLSHSENVSRIQFSLDSALLMTFTEESGYTEKLKIWDAAMGTPTSTVPGDNFAVANDFSTIASSKDNTVTLYNLNGSPSGAKFNTALEIRKLALSSESSRVAAALSDGTVWLWENRNAESIDSFDGFEDSEWSKLEFSPTGTRLAYSSANSIVKLRDGISGRFVADLRRGSSYKFEFSGDGSRIASLSYDDSLTLWNSESGGLIGEVKDDVGWQGLAISANGSLIATRDANKVTLWSGNNDSLVQIKVLELDKPSLMTFSLNGVLAIATRTSIKLYNVKTHSFIQSLPPRISSALAFSPDCTRIVVGEYYGNVNLYDIRGIDTSDPPSKDATCVTAVALSRDCSRLACGFADGTVELWGTSPTKQRIASHPAHQRSVQALVFCPSGGLFASSGGYGSIKLWNAGDGSLRGTLEAPGWLKLAALSNSVLVATKDYKVILWSLDTLSLIHTFDMLSHSTTVSIAENNVLIAVAHYRGVSLLDSRNHRTIATLDVDHQIHTMTFLSDNSHLVALSKDGVFLSFNLVNKHVTKGAALEHLIQLPNISLWRGVPIWHCQDRDSKQHYFAALFSQHKTPVPVLWIPSCIDVTVWTQRSSMIALVCCDGRVILLRLPTSHVG